MSFGPLFRFVIGAGIHCENCFGASGPLGLIRGMNTVSSPIIVLPGAGRESVDLTVFTDDPGDVARFRTIDYPGWRRYSETDFSAEAFIADLASQIASIVPQAPIRILGISIGGHFGYAAALHLQAIGREIAGFCAIDTFMVSSSAPRAGWKGRAAALGLRLLRERRINDLSTFLRSRLLRACLRLAGDRLPTSVARFCLIRPIAANACPRQVA